MEYLILLALLGILGFLVYEKKFLPKGEKEQEMEERYREKLTDLEVKLKAAEKERDELSGKGKEMFANFTAYKEKNQALQDKLDDVMKKVTKFETEDVQKDKEFKKQVTDLERARASLEDEKTRIRREDEERQKH